MSVSPRQYLLDRFRADGVALRERAAALKAAPKQPGPDAATSARMATACDDVTQMIEAIPEGAAIPTMLEALTAIIPLLEQYAGKVASNPPLRAVYVGAATRVREIVAAEQQAMSIAVQSTEFELDDGEFDDDFTSDDDDDVDDDEIDDRDTNGEHRA